MDVEHSSSLQWSGCASGRGAGFAGTQVIHQGLRWVDKENTSTWAESVRFQPNPVPTEESDGPLGEVENVTGMEHRVTVQEIKRMTGPKLDLPPGAQNKTCLQLTEEENYPFSCDKPLYHTLGMRGPIHARSPGFDVSHPGWTSRIRSKSRSETGAPTFCRRHCVIFGSTLKYLVLFSKIHSLPH
jgi:hypothetical protein